MSSATRENRKKRDPDDPFDEFVVSTSIDRSLLRRLSWLVGPHRALFVKSLLVLTVLFVLNLAGPWLRKHAIDGPVMSAVEAKIRADATETTPDVSPFVGQFWWWMGIYVATVLAAIWFRYLEFSQLNRTDQVVISDLRSQLFAHMQSLDLSLGTVEAARLLERAVPRIELSGPAGHGVLIGAIGDFVIDVIEHGPMPASVGTTHDQGHRPFWRPDRAR